MNLNIKLLAVLLTARFMVMMMNQIKPFLTHPCMSRSIVSANAVLDHTAPRMEKSVARLAS